MSNRQRILDYINDNPTKQFTNIELAGDLNIPEASVRRETLRLVNEVSINDKGKGSKGRLIVGATDEVIERYQASIQ